MVYPKASKLPPCMHHYSMWLPVQLSWPLTVQLMVRLSCWLSLPPSLQRAGELSGRQLMLLQVTPQFTSAGRRLINSCGLFQQPPKATSTAAELRTTRAYPATHRKAHRRCRDTTDSPSSVVTDRNHRITGSCRKLNSGVSGQC